MRKLVILIQPPIDEAQFEAGWPAFLHQAEQMPGLLREASCQVDKVVYGEGNYTLIHELYFDSLEAIQEALASPQGRAAGKLLQSITNGRLTILIADHKEDTLEHISSFKKAEDQEPSADIH